jgi:hypothetical protein
MDQSSAAGDDTKQFFSYCHGVLKKLKNGEKKTYTFEKDELFDEVTVKVEMTKNSALCEFFFF